jgi:hypothetical protein
MTKVEVCTKMSDFIEGRDRSARLAGEIEVALDQMCGDVEPYASLVLALASYRPGGGEFLYDEASILPMMKAALRELIASKE